MRLIPKNVTLLTPISSSSEDVNFPASNLSNPFRDKEWRSSGYYEITSANNKIDFTGYVVDIGPFPENPPRVAVGNYNSEDLASAVMNKLTSRKDYGSNPEPFEVEFDLNTGLWTISNPDDFELNNTSDSILQVLGFTQTTYTGSNSYTGEVASWHTSEWVVFDLGGAVTIDSIVLLWGVNSPKPSETAVVKVQGNGTNSWTSPSFEQVMVIDNLKPVSSAFVATQAFRYWRIIIVDPDNVNGYVNLGVSFMGIKASIRNADNGFSWNLIDGSVRSRTDYGQEYVDEYPILKNISFSMTNLDYDDVLTLNDIYQSVGSKSNVYFELYDDIPNFDKDFFCVYGKFDSSLSFVHVNYKIFNGSLVITETN